MEVKKRLFYLIIFLLFLLSHLNSLLSAEEISLFVNNKKIDCPVAPRIINGTIMVPMRPLFEALEASVYWNDESNTAQAFKGEREVTLTAGSNIAYVDGNKYELNTPPVIISDTTFIPLRFVSEAFGAQVKWDEKAGTASVNFDSEKDLTEEIKPALEKKYMGTLTEIIPGEKDDLPVMVIETEEGLMTFLISPGTFITREEVGGAFSGSSSLDQLMDGDNLYVTPLPDTNTALFIQAIYEEIEGKIIEIQDDYVRLDSGKKIKLHSEVKIYNKEDMPLSREELLPGSDVFMRVNPVLRETRYVKILTQMTYPGGNDPDKIEEGPHVQSFKHDAAETLESGDAVYLIMLGSKGGKAWFDFGDYEQEIPFAETGPGIYKSAYTIPDVESSGEIYLTAYIQVNGEVSEPFKAETPVRVEKIIPPVIKGYSPEDMSETGDKDPEICIEFDEIEGAPIDRAEISLKINGLEVSDDAKISPYKIEYKTEYDLPYGENKIEFEALYSKKKKITKEWVFIVEERENGFLHFLEEVLPEILDGY